MKKTKKTKQRRQIDRLVRENKERIIRGFESIGMDMSVPANRKFAYNAVRNDVLDRIKEAKTKGHAMSTGAAMKRVMHSQVFMTEHESETHRLLEGLKSSGRWEKFRRLNRHQKIDISKITYEHHTRDDGEAESDYYYDLGTKKEMRRIHIHIEGHSEHLQYTITKERYEPGDDIIPIGVWTVIQ